MEEGVSRMKQTVGRSDHREVEANSPWPSQYPSPPSTELLAKTTVLAGRAACPIL